MTVKRLDLGMSKSVARVRIDFERIIRFLVGAETNFDCAAASDVIGCIGSFGVTTCVCDRDLCNKGRGSPTASVPSAFMLASAAAAAAFAAASKF